MFKGGEAEHRSDASERRIGTGEIRERSHR